MTHPLQIRRAVEQEAAVVSKILYQSFVEFEPLYTPAGFAATTLQAEQVVERMREGPVWIAFHGNEAVGTVAAVAKKESVYVRGMAVLPSARGLRVGSRLLDTVEEWTKEQGVSYMFLTTTPFLHAAILLYERHGFCRKAGEQDLFGTPLFTMEKTIPAK